MSYVFAEATADARFALSFSVPAVPVAQPRPRAFLRPGASRAAMAPPPKSHPVHDFKASVREACRLRFKGPPLECALALRIVFLMPRPNSMMWKKRAMPRAPYLVKRNDWDNLGKGLCDALNQLLYRDDGQLVNVTVERWFAAGDEAPHVECYFWEVP